MKIALLQMNSIADVAANIKQMNDLAEKAVALEKPDMIVTPEIWNWFGGSTREVRQRRPEARRPFISGRTGAGEEAQDLGPRRLDRRASRRAARCQMSVRVRPRGQGSGPLLQDPHVRHYAPDGARYEESATVKPGTEIVTYNCEGVTIGCAICYDLRFPELFQALAPKGAEVIMLPAAFTQQTGKDHWEVLIRARAIETETYMVAAGQTGGHRSEDGSTRLCYGHSLIADPWGHVIARASDGVGFTAGRIDTAYIVKCRKQIPVLEHKVVGTARMPLRPATPIAAE